MNTNLLNIVKRIIAEQGEAILSEPKRVSAFFSDLAREIPKPQKNAFIKCLEHKSAEKLKNVTEADRLDSKKQLAQKLHEEEGFDLGLCAETIDLLEKVIFGDVKEKIFCKSCKKELQEEWKACPFCSTQVADDKKYIVNSSKDEEIGIHKIENDSDKPFIMPIEDVFFIQGRGTVVTGKVKQGIIKLHDEVEIIGIRSAKKTVITGIEMFNKILDKAQAGDNIGVLLYGIDKNEIERGQVLTKQECNSDIKKTCQGCSQNNNGRCNYYGLSIIDAVKYDCGKRKKI